MKNKITFFKKKHFRYLITILIISIILSGVISYFIGGGDYSLSHSLKDTKSIPDAIVNIILGILGAILQIMYWVFAGLLAPLLDAFQDAVFILLGGGWFTKAFHISYLTFIKGFSLFFLIFLMVFATVAILAKKNDGIIFRIVKGMLLFCAMPLIFWGLFSLVGLMTNWISGSPFIGKSISELIDSFSVGAIDDSTSGIDRFFLTSIGLLTILGVFKFFFEFLLAITNRVYEIFLFGIIGIGLASSAIVSDNGKRMGTYNSIMLTKLFNAFFCFLGYLIVINILPSIIPLIQNGDFETHYSKSDMYLRNILSMVIVLASFMLLKSLSTEWAFLISGDAKGALATQLNQVGGVSKMVTVPISKFQKRMTKKGFSLARKTSKHLRNSIHPDDKQRIHSLNKSFNKKVGNSNGDEREKNINEWYKSNMKKINKVNQSAKNDSEFKTMINGTKDFEPSKGRKKESNK